MAYQGRQRHEGDMRLSEADTKAKLIDPVLHQRGWTNEGETFTNREYRDIFKVTKKPQLPI
jgi:type I site-specific restriction endonuclease